MLNKIIFGIFILFLSIQPAHADDSQYQDNLKQWNNLTEQQKQEYRLRMQEFRNMVPSMRGARILNSVSRSRSGVGRVARPGSVFSLRDRNSPPIIRISPPSPGRSAAASDRGCTPRRGAVPRPMADG